MILGNRRRVAVWLVVAMAAGGAGWAWRAGRAVPVELARAEQREVVELVIASGKLRAVRQSDVSSEVSGRVESVEVREGAVVTNGQVVAVLRQTEFLKLLEQARTGVEAAREEAQRARVTREEAEINWGRISALFEQRVASQSELDGARAARDVARAAELTGLARLREAEAFVRVAEERAATRRIEAPFAGVVLKRWVEPGQSVSVGSPLLTIAESGEVEIYVETDENNLAKLKVGQRAMVVAPGYRDRPFTAGVTQIGPGVDYDRGVVGVRLVPERVPEYALMNMTVDVSIEVARTAGALSVPSDAVVEREGRAEVLVVEGGRAVAKPVRLLGRGGDRAGVAGEGLVEGTEVVAQATGVRPGQRVTGREGR